MTEEVKDQQPSELDTLKKRARQLGIKHSPKIGVDKLRTMVNGQLAPAIETKEEDVTRKEVTSPLDKARRAAKAVPANEVAKLSVQEEASKLVRIHVTCMNPNKTEWEGEIFTVGNDVIRFKKYVPFNNSEGWHVPNMIFEMMKERKCQVFFNTKDDKGNTTRKGKLISEFAIQVLPPLTADEYIKLGQRQAMANGTAE